MDSKSISNDERKAYVDFIKYVNTLSIALLFGIVGFIKNLIPNPKWNFLVVVSLICFLITIVFGLLLISSTLFYSLRKREDVVSKPLGNMVHKSIVIFVLAFIFGIISILTFVLVNFFLNQ